MNTMKAIFFEKFGGSDQLKIGHFPIPQPALNEVQIQIVCTAINPVDWKIRQGLLENRLPHQFPIIPGWDAAGIISAIGSNIQKFKIGDEVFAYCRKPIIKDGTYAEYICFDAANVAFKPTNISFSQAAAIPLAGLTAWQALFDAAHLQREESVLIHAGSGGVGSIAIQLAKYIDARVITTARKSNEDYLKSLGADLVLDYREGALTEQINQFAPQGLDVIFDTVGGNSLKAAYSLLKPGGRLVSIVEHPDQALAEQFKIRAYYVFVAPNGKELQDISNLIKSGKVKPIKIQEMPLEKAEEAQELNRIGHAEGKIILTI